ncbi:hypothetical protein [Sunxiuqinia dokdonensis]|uniref:DUF4468 domain-containing protein n=1 Tax=Sunxiuqinia dokdonensis TaxID=1409788 RepID=A0A0L8V4K4_9BACT|nr:hypothetical protein [Sunxiuqinia dokdonensis]KOH43283.1 hypothetical protein NC99_39130 [Sunxiuqinia dokdonensis]
MKKLVYLVFLLISMNAFSQHEIVVSIVDRPSSMGLAPAFETAIPSADLKMADDLFEQMIAGKRFFGLLKKKRANTKEGHERMTEEFVFEQVSSSPMVILFQVTDFSSQTYIRFFFKMRDGFLGAPGIGSKSEIASAEEFVHSYASRLYAQTLGAKIAEEQKIFSKYEKKYNKLERKKRKIEKRYFTGQPRMDPENSEGDLIDVEQAVADEEKFLKGKKKGQKKIRRIQKKQAKWEGRMKNQQIIIDRLKRELNAIN